MNITIFYCYHLLTNIIYINVIYIYIYIYIQSTPDKSDSQETGKIVRLSEMSDLSEIKNIMQIRHEILSASLIITEIWNYATISNIKCCIQLNYLLKL